MNYIHKKPNTDSVSSMLSKADRASKKGELTKAIELYRAILAKFPNNKKAKSKLIELSRLNPLPDLTKLISEERYDDVLQILLSNIERDNQNPHFWKLLGIVYSESGESSLSLQCFQKALELKPTDVDLIYHVGCDLLKLDDLGNAYKAFKHCLAIKPNFAGAYTNIGAIYDRIESMEKASEHWKKAIEIDPKDSLALSYLGCWSSKLGNQDEALEFFFRAVDADPENVNNYVNIATTYYEMEKTQEALEIYETWEQRNWDNVSDKYKYDYNLNYSIALFTDGQVEKAWDLYRNRHYTDKIAPINTEALGTQRLPDVKAAYEQRILVISEQGIGDQIKFLGLLNSFQNMTNSKIELLVEPRYRTLLERSLPQCNVIVNLEEMRASENFWMLYGDIGDLMRFDKTKEGLSAPYIKPDSTLVTRWQKKLYSDRPNIGIAWRSGLMTPTRLKSYTRLGDWADIIKNDKINPVCLQYGDISEDLKELTDDALENFYIPDFDLKNDFETLSAVISNCDLVIGPATAPINQSEAQGASTIMYELKGLDRFSFGKNLEASEYTSVWYPNCRMINFSQSNKKALTKRVEEIILETLL